MTQADSGREARVPPQTPPARAPIRSFWRSLSSSRFCFLALLWYATLCDFDSPVCFWSQSSRRPLNWLPLIFAVASRWYSGLFVDYRHRRMRLIQYFYADNLFDKPIS
jgi:hypothetical protein